MLERSEYTTPAEIIAATGLPADYMTLTDDGQRKARMAVLRSWFDPQEPDTFCTDPNAFVRARKLWEYHYMRPAQMNAAIYTEPNPLHKWDMVRAIVHEPTQEQLPSRTAIHAPRGTTKTRTCFVDTMTMVMCVRPYTEALYSQANASMTTRQMDKIRRQFEDNEQIHADFGGQGKLFPNPWSRRRRRVWSGDRLEFIHLPGNSLSGVSVGSSHRGMRVLVGIIDDPQKAEGAAKKGRGGGAETSKEKFLSWLFGVYQPMFRKGGCIFWLDTVRPGNCIEAALHRLIYEQEYEEFAAHIKQFDDWNRMLIKMIQTDAEGQRFSVWDSYINIKTADEAMLENRGIGRKAFMSEMQGEPIAGGAFCFARDPVRHGYSKVERNGKPFFVDHKNGKTMPWDEWLKGLAVYGGVDWTTGVSEQSDPAAVVFIGIDSDGEVFVVDSFYRRMYPDQTIEYALSAGAAYRCIRIGWEAGALQEDFARRAIARSIQLRKEGKRVPYGESLPAGVGAANGKVQRALLHLEPLYREDRIRFRNYDQAVCPGAMDDAKKSHHEYLKRELDQCADLPNKDQALHGVDALVMAVRTARNARGSQKESDPILEKNREILANMKKLGMKMPGYRDLPPDCWTPEMVDEYRMRYNPLLQPKRKTRELNPYGP